MKKISRNGDYRIVRDKVWEIQTKCKINALPVDVFDVCKKLDIKVYTYMKGFNLIQTFDLQSHVKHNDGFSTMINGHYVIFYNSFVKPQGRVRFTIAHEIGHIVLGHLLEESVACRNGATAWNSGEKPAQNALERDANIFASRLLAPACVLWALKIAEPQHISRLCGLSKTAALIRANRMQELYRREDEYLMRYNRSCFLLSPDERKLYEQFKPFIRSMKIKKD